MAKRQARAVAGRGAVRKVVPRKVSGQSQKNTVLNAAVQGSKIIVSGFPFDVTEGQIQEFFQKSVGPLKKCTLNYGPNGRSSGTATIYFQRPGDAQKAYSSYHGRMIDNKSHLKIEIIVDPATVQSIPPALSSRINTLPANKAVIRGASTARRGGPIRGRGGKRASQKPKTVEQLDAEMADYFEPK